MADVTWFKVLTDIFSDDKIKILQSMPEGDALLVMWFKVLAQAGKTNDGGYIYLKKNIPYTSSMLSTLFNKNQLLVDLAVRTFSEFGMIDIDEKGYIFVTNWERHQSIDALEKIKEQTRTRVQSHRDKKKLELQESNATVTLHVTQRNATELELELDLELEKEKDKTCSGGGQNPFKLFESEGFGTISSVVGEKLGYLMDDYGERWVIEAMKESVVQGKRTLSYVDGILKRWKAEGIDSPWTKQKVGEPHAEHQGSVKDIRHGRTQTTSRDSEKSSVSKGRWDDTVIPMPGMSGYGRNDEEKTHHPTGT